MRFPPFTAGVGVSPNTGGNQGVTTDATGNFYISSSSSLKAYDAKFNTLWQNSNALSGLPSAVNHIGDVAYSNGYLFAPVEQYTNCVAYGSALLAVYSASTGKLVTWSDISADAHEASSVTVVPESNQLVVSSYCGDNQGYKALWKYDVNALTTNSAGSILSPAGTIALSDQISLIQGISWNSTAKLFAISADNNGPSGSLWFVSPAGIVTGPVYQVPVEAGVELEGVDYTSGYLYFLEGGNVYGIGAVPDPPVFGVPPGSYTSAQTITISDTSAGAAIHYTSDGSMPTAASTLYSGPITVSSNATFKAIAVVSGSATSAMAAATYSIGK